MEQLKIVTLSLNIANQDFKKNLNLFRGFSQVNWNGIPGVMVGLEIIPDEGVGTNCCK